MDNIIRIRKATFYAYHGVLTEEQSVGGKFEAEVDIYTDFSGASAHDNLQQTIDYNSVYKFMYKLVLEQKYYLLESLTYKIANELLKNFTKINKIAVRIRKNNPPLGGVIDYVEVEVIKSREEMEDQK